MKNLESTCLNTDKDDSFLDYIDTLCHIFFWNIHWYLIKIDGKQRAHYIATVRECLDNLYMMYLLDTDRFNNIPDNFFLDIYNFEIKNHNEKERKFIGSFELWKKENLVNKKYICSILFKNARDYHSKQYIKDNINYFGYYLGKEMGSDPQW